MAESDFFEWSDAISVGVKEVDDQHKVLISLLNRLFVAVAQRKGNEILAEILEALIEYAKTHFALEEQLMEEAGYNPVKLEAHRDEHRSFVVKLGELSRKHLEEGKPISFEVVHFLKRWLYDHILVTDRGYAIALKKAGLSSKALDAFSAGARAAEAAAKPETSRWWKIW